MSNPLSISIVLVIFFIIAIVLQLVNLCRINRNISLIVKELDKKQERLNSILIDTGLIARDFQESIAELRQVIKKLKRVIKNI